mgnify:CR=1 FL=1
MNTLICGSLAFDNIMVFPDRFTAAFLLVRFALRTSLVPTAAPPYDAGLWAISALVITMSRCLGPPPSA